MDGGPGSHRSGPQGGLEPVSAEGGPSGFPSCTTTGWVSLVNTRSSRKFPFPVLGRGGGILILCKIPLNSPCNLFVEPIGRKKPTLCGTPVKVETLSY